MKDHDEIVDIIRRVANRHGGTVRSSYSGRGMFGKTCYGIVCRAPITVIESASAKGLTGALTDDMGMQSIVYWPKIKGTE